ncbi:MAG: deoxyribose-phosphate aldolase [Enterococcus sp.]
MKVNEKICLRVLDAAMTDWAFKDLLLALPEKNIKEIIVLPSYLRRAKQLLARTAIKIGAVVDYPLGAGTISKKAFEVGQLFQQGADFLEVTISEELLLHQTAELDQFQTNIHPLTLVWGEVRMHLVTDQMKELAKISCAQKINRLGWKTISLGQKLSIKQALHDSVIFEYDGGKNLAIQLNLDYLDFQELAELLQTKVQKIGLIHSDSLDLLYELPTNAS